VHLGPCLVPTQAPGAQATRPAHEGCASRLRNPVLKLTSKGLAHSRRDGLSILSDMMHVVRCCRCAAPAVLLLLLQLIHGMHCESTAAICSCKCVFGFNNDSCERLLHKL
jgi:hypothetical protein